MGRCYVQSYIGWEGRFSSKVVLKEEGRSSNLSPKYFAHIINVQFNSMDYFIALLAILHFECSVVHCIKL